MPAGCCACRRAEARQACGSFVCIAACAAYGDRSSPTNGRARHLGAARCRRSTPAGLSSVLVRCCPLLSVSVRTPVSLHVALCIAPAAHRFYPRPPPLPSVLSQHSSRFIVRTCPLMSVSVRTTALLHEALGSAPAASLGYSASRLKSSFLQKYYQKIIFRLEI